MLWQDEERGLRAFDRRRIAKSQHDGPREENVRYDWWKEGADYSCRAMYAHNGQIWHDCLAFDA